MWMDIGWGLYFQVVGTHKHYMSSSKFFPPLVVGALKPSITFVSLPLGPLAPSHSPCSLLLPSLPLAPLLLPLLPLLPLTPSHSPHSLLLPLTPCLHRGGGTPKHSITYPYPTLAIGSKREWEGASWEWPSAQQRWWASQNIPLDHHYALPPLSQLWVRGVSWEWGEGLLV